MTNPEDDADDEARITKVVQDYTMGFLSALEMKGLQVPQVMYLILETLAAHVTLYSLAEGLGPYEPLGFMTSCIVSGHAMGLDTAEEEGNPQ